MAGKVIITGPGRSGTTFLVQLLGRLGLDTGFEPYNEPVRPDFRAGLEYTSVAIDYDKQSLAEIRQSIDDAPQVLKAPEWGMVLKSLLANNIIEVEHVFVPVRDLDTAAVSRLSVGLDWMIPPEVPEDERVGVQAEIHAMALGRVVEACLLYSVPCTIMAFPLLVQDVDYCYRKLSEYRMFDKDEMGQIWKELTREPLKKFLRPNLAYA